MIAAFLWGALGASALVIGAWIAYTGRPSKRLIAVVMALGTGLLIGSVSFELIDEAIENSDPGMVGLMALVGAGVFTLGDWWLARQGGGDRKDPEGAQAEGQAKAIVF